MVCTHETHQFVDYLSHPFSGQGQTPHHQPHLHRRARPSTFRPQGRLPGRVRRCSSHRLSSDLRGHLRPSGGQFGRGFRIIFRFIATPAASPRSLSTATDFYRLLPIPTQAQISSTRPYPPQPDFRPRFPIANLEKQTAPQTAFGWRSAPSAAIKPLLKLRALAPGVPKEIISSNPSAFGWRSASSAAIKPLPKLRALAPEVPKEIISSNPTSTFRKANENCPHQTSVLLKRRHNRGRAPLQRRGKDWK